MAQTDAAAADDFGFGDSDDATEATAAPSSTAIDDYLHMTQAEERCGWWRMSSARARWVYLGTALALLCVFINVCVAISQVAVPTGGKAAGSLVLSIVVMLCTVGLAYAGLCRKWIIVP